MIKGQLLDSDGDLRKGPPGPTGPKGDTGDQANITPPIHLGRDGIGVGVGSVNSTNIVVPYPNPFLNGIVIGPAQPIDFQNRNTAGLNIIVPIPATNKNQTALRVRPNGQMFPDFFRVSADGNVYTYGNLYHQVKEDYLKKSEINTDSLSRISALKLGYTELDNEVLKSKFIASEVIKTLPHCIHSEKSQNGKQTHYIDYNSIFIEGIAAIQELAKVKAEKQELDEVKAENLKLKEKLLDLEALHHELKTSYENERSEWLASFNTLKREFQQVTERLVHLENQNKT